MLVKNNDETNVELLHDGEVAISIGKSRKEVHWKNKSMLWSLFVDRVSRTTPTHETMSEYFKSDKSRQAEIKDVGGFVGGTLTSGKRRADSVASRSMLTLDLDFVNGSADDFWMLFTLLFCNAGLVYSTHKHTPEKPRLRLVIPFNREVTPAEYIAIARRIAGLLGIEQFDDSTYEPERLMYWPSTSKDAEFYFMAQDGNWLDVDTILKSYKNWQDSSEWPVSNRQGDAVRREIRKQENPLDKKGIVGTFCRTYDIHKAIETFLPEVYEACDVDNRYTYKEGSSAAGMVVYDDIFAYSHHGTDPASGQLCNAFDLVRIHLFGDRDADVERNGTRKDRYPSFVLMEELCLKDKIVKKLLMLERSNSAKDDFDGIEIEEDDSWKEKLDCDKKGNVLPLRRNIAHILEHDPDTGSIAFNTFSMCRVFKDKLPVWRKKGDADMAFRDDDEENIRTYLESQYGIDSKAKISDAVGVVARKNAFHPIREYLDSLVWDGVKRVETFFIDYLGVEDCELYRTCTKAALAAGVARVVSPGIEHDHVIVLVGAQGVGKSKLLAKLAKSRKWFNDSIDIEDNKKAYEGVRGKWIVEMAELVGFKKADAEKLKRFFTSTNDYYRAAYAKYALDQERQCVFFGTTNDLTFLRDPTGDRRFWPMEVRRERINKNQWEDLTEDEIDQVWAEAKYLFENGQQIFLPKDLEEEMNIRRGCYMEEDDRKGLIQEYLDTLLPADWETKSIEERVRYVGGDPLNPVGTIQRDHVCIAEIWCECFKRQKADLVRSQSREVMNLMRQVDGWQWAGKTERTGPYGVQKYFERIDKTELVGHVAGENEVTSISVGNIFD